MLRVTNYDVAIYSYFDAKAILCHPTLICFKYSTINFFI